MLARPITARADEVAVGASSATFPGTSPAALMTVGILYVYCANVASWIAQGASPTASAAAGSMFVPANTQVLIDGAQGAKLAVIQDSSGGKASLTPVLL